MNVIADNMIYQEDLDGHNYQVLKEISDYYVHGSALKRTDEFIRSCDGKLHAKNTTRGCKSEVKRKD